MTELDARQKAALRRLSDALQEMCDSGLNEHPYLLGEVAGCSVDSRRFSDEVVTMFYSGVVKANERLLRRDATVDPVLKAALLAIITQDLGNDGYINNTRKQPKWLWAQLGFHASERVRSTSLSEVRRVLDHLTRHGEVAYSHGYYTATEPPRRHLRDHLIAHHWSPDIAERAHEAFVRRVPFDWLPGVLFPLVDGNDVVLRSLLANIQDWETDTMRFPR